MADLIKSIIKKYKVNVLNISHSSNKKHILNECVEQIFIINLISNKLRRNYIIMLMKKYKINFTLIIVDKIDDKTYNIINQNKKLKKSEVGCCLSHLWCLDKIMEEKLKNAIIFEDDIIFHKNFKHIFYELFSKKKYDFLLLGACDFHFSKKNYQYLNKGVYKPDKTSTKVYGAHANYYSLKGASKMFNSTIQDIYFFDRNYNIMFDYFNDTSFICYPNLVVSDISTTNLDHTYDFFTSNENYYYTSCFKNFNFCDYNFIYLSIISKNKHILIKKEDDYESYSKKIIENTFESLKQQYEIKNRLVMDFFDMKDIKFLLSF